MGNLERNNYVVSRITESIICLLQRKELAEISVSEIVEYAQVSRNSFYRNFDSKEDVLRRYAMTITDRFLRQTQISLRSEPIDEYLVKLFTHLHHYRDECMLLHRRGLIHVVQSEFDRVFQTRYAGIYDEFKMRFYAGGIYSIFLMWLEGGCVETPHTLAARLSGLLEQ